MGIYDRDYYRREGPSFLESFSGSAVVCKWLILINIGVFFLQLATLPRGGREKWDAEGQPQPEMGYLTDALDLQPDKVVYQGQIWRLLTHAFLHSLSPLHIIFNMLFLWWMGHELEEMYGPREFLTLYLCAAVFAGLCLTVHGLLMPYRIAGLGASGAVAGLTMLYAIHWPHRTILLFFVLPVPIWVMAAIFFGSDFILFLRGEITGARSQTAVSAHLGGALFGYLYYRFQWKLTGLFSGFQSWKKRRSRPPLRIYREEEPTPAAVAAPRAQAERELDEHFEAKLDAVLAKMSQVGKDNLSEAEKEVLLRASEIYRKRRT